VAYAAWTRMQKQTWRRVRAMSALPQKADISTSNQFRCVLVHAVFVFADRQKAQCDPRHYRDLRQASVLMVE
jgi:hypothetical protein